MKYHKIVRVCEEYPPIKGGLSSGMFDLTEAQHNMGNHVTVITRSHPGDSEIDAKLPYSVIRIDAKRIIAFGLKAYSKIRELSTKPDIVHTHGPAAFSYLLRRKKDDPPLVHTMHAVRKYQFGRFKKLPEMVKSFEKKIGSRALKKPDYYKRFYPKVLKELFLERYICQRADHVLLASKYFLNQIRNYYDVPHRKISVSYNGSKFKPSDFSLPKTKVIETLGIDPKKKIILYIGRTDWVKRVHILIEAMPIILNKFPDAQLMIVGKGDHDADLPRLSEKNSLKDSVKFLSWLPHEDVPSLFKISKCFCLPSYWEGLSKAVLEAFSAEIPFIGTANLANMELTRNGEFGWLVHETTPVEWGNAICKVLRGGSQVREKVKKASNIVDQRYRWNHVAQRIDAAYKKVLNEKYNGNK